VALKKHVFIPTFVFEDISFVCKLFWQRLYSFFTLKVKKKNRALACRGCDHGRCYVGQHFVDAGAMEHSHLRSEVHKTQGFTQVQPLRRVKGICPARFITQWRITMGGSVGGYAKSYEGEIGSQMMCLSRV
jgi:hypothetical protein